MTTITHGKVEAELVEAIAVATAGVDYYDNAAWRVAVREGRITFLLAEAGAASLDALSDEARRMVEWAGYTLDNPTIGGVVALMRAAAAAATPPEPSTAPLSYPAYGWLAGGQHIAPGRTVLAVDVDVDQVGYPIVCPRCADRGRRSLLDVDRAGDARCRGTTTSDGCELVIRRALIRPSEPVTRDDAIARVAAELGAAIADETGWCDPPPGAVDDLARTEATRAVDALADTGALNLEVRA